MRGEMYEEEFDCKSEIGRLIQHLQKLSKKPQIDNQLSSALEVFQEKVARQKAYLKNGIFNINFAEAALFLQSCAELYGKKIDLLWDQLLEFHTRLIEYDCQHEQEKGKKMNQEAIEKLEERRNRFKRKKKFKLVVGQNNTNVLEDFLFEKPSALNEIEPYELNEDCFKSWRVVENESSLITKIPKAVYKQQLLKYRLKNYRILKSEDFDICDPNDGEFNTKYSRVPGWHVIEHIFEYNTKGLLPDKNNAIATLRLSCYLRAQFMRDNKIPFNAPYSQYKDQYLEFKKKFFEEEAKKWQNMPLNTMADLRRQFEYLAKMEKENEEKKETYKPWLEVFPSYLKTSCNIINCPDCLESKSSIITISDSLDTDLDDTKDISKTELSVNVEKLPEDVVEKLRQDSGYFELEDIDKDISTCEESVDVNNCTSVVDVTENISRHENIGENGQFHEIAKESNNESESHNDTPTKSSRIIEKTLTAEIEKEVEMEGMLEQGKNNTNTLNNNEQQINSSIIAENTLEITETNVMSEENSAENITNNSMNDKTSESASKVVPTEKLANSNVGLDDDDPDDDIRSIISDHNYCELTDQVNILKENKNIMNKTSEEEMAPLKLASKIVPRAARTRVAKENRPKVALMGPPLPKRRKLSQKQLDKLVQSKIVPVNEMRFEKFFSLNYHPQMGEGEIQDINYESEDETNREEIPLSEPITEDKLPEEVAGASRTDHKDDDMQSIASDHSYCQVPGEPGSVVGVSNPVHDNDDAHSIMSDHSYCQHPEGTKDNEDQPNLNDSGFIDNSQTLLSLDSSEQQSANQTPTQETVMNSSSHAMLRGLEPEDVEEYERLLAEAREERRKECEEMNILPEDVAKERERRDRERLESKARVEEWRETITPILKNLKENDFDIHEYGGKVMEGMEIGEMKPFKNIVNGKSSAEVVRYLIASLQLANTYNIEICGAKSGKMSNDTYCVKLLNTNRYHENLSNYHAPSEDSFREKIKKMRTLKNPEESAENGEIGEPSSKRLRVDKTPSKKRIRREISSSDDDDNYEPPASSSCNTTPVSSSQNRVRYGIKRLKSSSNAPSDTFKEQTVTVATQLMDTIRNVDVNTPSTSATAIENFESELAVAQQINPDIQMFSTPLSVQPTRLVEPVLLNQRLLFQS